MPPRLLAMTLMLLGGCAAPAARYPSLLPRAVEGRSEAEAVPPAPAVVADPALEQAIAAARATLVEVGRDGDTLLGQAMPPSATVAGSEGWIAAQVALAQLDEVRARASDVATDLEERAIARAAAGQPSYPALDAAQGEAQALVARIERGTAWRQAALPPG